MMDLNCKIEVSIDPDPEMAPTPYFWCILIFKRTNWCNEGFGWSETPEQAWKDALSYYERNVV